ncbi:Alcohol dehydrogenase transcription factor Myb/SANT-like [Popillia japonica]|uniref:Alcohol dehydrogenase transcription factor Myb/SANT-like n=1 Tax=Popillia japonica TaxID=7064 RepID=A0AAW1LQJ3_POPJA
MNNEDIIRFIEIYQSYRFLYAKSKAHQNRYKRGDAWKEISLQLQQPVAVLQAKTKSLIGSYRSERSREKKTRVTGSGMGIIDYFKHNASVTSSFISVNLYKE